MISVLRKCREESEKSQVILDCIWEQMTGAKASRICVSLWRLLDEPDPCMLGRLSPAKLHLDLSCCTETGCFSVTRCACL